MMPIYLFTTMYEEAGYFIHFFYDLEQKLYITVIFDYYVFENMNLNISYFDNNNQTVRYDETILSITDDELYIIDGKYSKTENRLMMCEQILMSKILDTI